MPVTQLLQSTHRSLSPRAHSFHTTYDAENKQTKVESLSTGTQIVTGTIGEYFYDGDGKRIKKRAYENNVPTEETIFVYS